MSFYKRLISHKSQDESYRAFGIRVGIDHVTILKWRDRHDAGREANPKPRTLEPACQALGVTMSWLLLGEGKGPQGSDEPERATTDNGRPRRTKKALRAQDNNNQSNTEARP